MSNELEVKKQVKMSDYVDSLSNSVEGEISRLTNSRRLVLPKNYSAENALKAACLILQETVDKDKRPVLQVCTKDSIANTLYNMVVQGLNPAKKQCYFIANGNKLSLMRSYFGSVAVAKQVDEELVEIIAEVVYEGDAFEYEIKRGKKIVTKHSQSIQNIDKKKIISAYAIAVYSDNTEKTEIMTMEQIKTAWTKSRMNISDSKSVHSQFTEDMSKRTVTNKICKKIINESDDHNLAIKEAYNLTDRELAEQEVIEKIETNANKELIDIEPTYELIAEPNISESGANNENNEYEVNENMGGLPERAF